MQNPGKGKGLVSKSGKMSNDDDLTSLSWLHNVNILPDSVASDDDQGGLTSPECDTENIEKFQFKNVESVMKTSTASSNNRLVKLSRPISTTTTTTMTNSFRLTNVSSPNQFSSNLMISSSSGATNSYSPSVLLNSLLVSTAPQQQGSQPPFSVAAKNIVVVSTASANGVYPGQYHSTALILHL
jgi:hypothetical protein